MRGAIPPGIDFWLEEKEGQEIKSRGKGLKITFWKERRREVEDSRIHLGDEKLPGGEHGPALGTRLIIKSER